METSKSASSWKSTIGQLESKLKLYLVDKAPAIPKQWRELIVKIAPWLSVIMAVMALPAILAAFGLTAALKPFAYVGGFGYGGAGFTLGWIFTLVIMVLEVSAIPGLFKRTKGAWSLLFYATLLTAVQNLIFFNLGSLIIGTLLGLYILFQVKEYYK
jgi:hypothetical protein